MSRQPWNKDRQVGARIALTQAEIGKIQKFLSAQNSSHDLCLFMTAVDSMLRASDVLQLRVRDVCAPNGTIKQSVLWKQKKTHKGVQLIFTPSTQKALTKWIGQSGKHHEDYLFTREKPRTNPPISIGFYRTLGSGLIKSSI